MQRIRIAVIGAGQIGRRHLSVLLADSAYEAAAIVDPAPEARAMAERNGVAWYSRLEQMLDQMRPDGAIIATPNQTHVAAGLACIACDVPVLVEKPIADSVPEALRLVQAGEAAGVPILTGHHRRHNPLMRAAADAIREGAVGSVTAVVSLWLSHKPEDYFKVAWRREPGGGTVLINGIHEIDCLRMLAGEIRTVQAASANHARGFPVEDTAAAVLTFESGALGTVVISDAVSSPWSWEWTSHENPFYPHESESCYLITGTRGSLSVPRLEHWWHEPGQGWGDPLTRRRIPYRPGDAYVEQMRNFAAVIRGQADPVISGREGARTLAATLAITQSARTGERVSVADLGGGR